MRNMRQALVCTLLMLTSVTSSAGAINTQPLSFGRIVLSHNASVGSYTIDYLGNISTTNHFRIIEAGSPAEFLLFDYPPNSQVFITPTVIQAETNSAPFSAEQFTLANLTSPGSVFIRTDGTSEINVGGTLRTSGSGSMNYSDADYTINLQVSFNF
ncbi:DUF4402 domain-containing protein [Marinomonas sp. 2405UD68-3]|uniref:DUF4402 domain-containing protein n=1 Tax=Marinomonas sp. 2405UD68-3 TaxID=3391835 RepID=UPI0039C8E8E9